MKKLTCLFILIFLIGCGDYVDKPKNLVDEDVMSKIIAEMALSEQASFTFRDQNLESETRFILKTYNVKTDDFTESYQYYVSKNKMNDIVKEAQKIILKKDPKADQYVKDKQAKTKVLPPSNIK